MGSKLTVESRPGQGSTFTLRLYLGKIAAPAPAPAPRSQSHHRPVTGRIGARRSLLVVDDMPQSPGALAQVLEAACSPIPVIFMTGLSETAHIVVGLGLSPRTVNKQLEHVFEKLGVETRSAAAALASRELG